MPWEKIDPHKIKVGDEITWSITEEEITTPHEACKVTHFSKMYFKIIVRCFPHGAFLMDDTINYFIWKDETNTVVPKSYQPIRRCANCKHVFIRVEHKAPTEYYCHIDHSDRPLCGSIKMGESEWPATLIDFSWPKWEKWKKAHQIEDEFGICDKYEERYRM